MKTTYKVVRRFYDKLCGINLAADAQIVINDGDRTVQWLDQAGNALTNGFTSPTDQDFAWLKGQYDNAAGAGVLSAGDAPKKTNGNGKKAEPPKQDPPKAEAKAENPPPPPGDPKK